MKMNLLNKVFFLLNGLFFAEYKNRGSGAVGERVKWSHQLSVDEAAKYTLANILGEWSTNPNLFITKNKNE